MDRRSEGIDLDGGGAGPKPLGTALQARAFRSTWIVASLESMHSSVHWPRYLAALREHREEVLSSVAGAWCPMPVARSHYLACDALSLSSADVTAVFDGPGGRIRQAWYAPFIAFAKEADMPWEVLARLEPMWLRSCDAGAVTIVRLAEREARVAFAGCELFDIAYFRESVRNVLFALFRHACDDHEVRVLPQSAPGGGTFAVRWT